MGKMCIRDSLYGESACMRTIRRVHGDDFTARLAKGVHLAKRRRNVYRAVRRNALRKPDDGQVHLTPDLQDVFRRIRPDAARAAQHRRIGHAAHDYRTVQRLIRKSLTGNHQSPLDLGEDGLDVYKRQVLLRVFK